MPRPCRDAHPNLTPATCRICYWCVDRSYTGRAYRELWGEPEPVSRYNKGLAKSVLVPQPPPLTLSPTSKVALVTVAVGEEGKALLDISRPFMEAYAARLGIDFVVVDWPGHPSWPMSSKFGIGRILDHYERIIYLDADVLPRPGCVDLLSLCPEQSLGACDELQFQYKQPQHGILKHYQILRQEIGHDITIIPSWYFNAGVMVVPRRYQYLLFPPLYPLPIRHLTEQEHTNAIALRDGIDFFPLSRECNWQQWTDHGFRQSPPNAILHFSGMLGETRLSFMREVASPDWKPQPRTVATAPLPPQPKPRLSISELAARKRY